MIERKIYSKWAFTENEDEKRKINHEIYNELKSKYTVWEKTKYTTCETCTNGEMEQYDIAISRTAGYHHSTYKILKNLPNLTTEELALICGRGNLCFGYTVEPNGDIYVFED